MFATVLAFAKGLLSNLKTYMYAGLAAGVLGLAYMSAHWVIGLQQQLASLQKKNADQTVQLTALQTQQQNDATVISTLQQSSKDQVAALKALNDQFNQARDTKNKQERILEGKQLADLAAKKAGLIQDKANQATEDRFKEFEQAINQ